LKASGFVNDDMSSLKVYKECKVTVYQHGDFTGWEATFRPGDYTHDLFTAGDAENDDASSIKVEGKDCVAVAYEHGDFTGWEASFGVGEYNHDAFVARGAKNDDMSALKVYVHPP
jgi:hypothetical protein